MFQVQNAEPSLPSLQKHVLPQMADSCHVLPLQVN
jgi:hypothetical protein